MAKNKNNGTVLIITIWVTTILAGVAVTLSWQIRTQSLQIENAIASTQAEFIVKGAIEYAKSKVEDYDATDTDNEDDFKEIELGNGHFWLIKPNLSTDIEVSYGLSDEAAKVNLNSASLEMLLKLPGMTSELAAAIIDWRDEDSEVTTGGAESEYYLLLKDSYECKNANFETVEEVLLVKGATREILFGEDYNCNGMLDENENDGNKSLPNDNSNGRLDGGFFNYVTVYSREDNKDSEGGDRINVSDRNNQGQIQEAIQTVLKEDAALEAMARIRAQQQYENVIDFYFTSGIEYDDFIEIADKFTTNDEEESIGMININNAPEEVLLCLPVLESKDVDDLIKKREKLSAAEKGTIIWITEALDRDKAIGIGSFITSKSCQFSADVIAITNNARAFRRYRAVIDTLNDNAVVYRKSYSHLGWPLDKDIYMDYKMSQEGIRLLVR